MFLHVTFLHIALNMYSLYFAGSILEQVIGRWRFLLLYLALRHRRLGGRARVEPNVADRRRVGRDLRHPRRALRARAARHIATGGQIAGLIVLNLVFTFAFSSHLGRRPRRRPDRRRHPDVAALHFRRSAVSAFLRAAAVVAASVVVAYAKVRNYRSGSAAGGDVRARAGLGQRGLRRGEARERHAERRAADVVEPELVAERDRARLAAVLAADAELELRLRRRGRARRRSASGRRRRRCRAPRTGCARARRPRGSA